jgi:ATP-dependent helicase HepA
LDPIEILAYKAHETAFFHTYRTRYFKNIMEQRAVARGMSGLISSNVLLLPHQTEVLQRVLRDPVQRYLLADEVGLGKTIEAGVIVRQYLIDHPDEKALIIAPPFLLNQWKKELHDRVCIDQFNPRVKWMTMDSFREIEADDVGSWGIVVFDEAHEVAKWAYSPSSKERKQFASVQALCRQTDGLLLLSATPVINNEQEFLAMLHLLDPEHYKLDDLKLFLVKLGKRLELGRELMTFRENTPSFLLKKSIERLRGFFTDDTLLAEMLDDLDVIFREELGDEAKRATIQRIRIHLSETYRLHRRMLRNRREVLQDIVPYSREQNKEKGRMLIEYDMDERSNQIQDLLEDWRYSSWSQESDKWEAPYTKGDTPYFRLFLLLWEVTGGSYTLLSEVVESRLNRKETALVRKEFPDETVNLLTKTPLFPQEESILSQMRSALVYPSQDGDRIELLSQSIEQIIAKHQRLASSKAMPKIVVFTNYTATCRELLEALKQRFKPEAVVGYHADLSRDEIETNMDAFRGHPNYCILVSDTTGEIGRNLQFAHHLIHFDLPLSPNRLEQRIGRLDRIGRTTPFRSTVMVGPEYNVNYSEGWFRFLHEGLHVFEESISSLQFYIDEILPALLRTAYAEGQLGLQTLTDQMQSNLGQEKMKIEEQMALDQIEAMEIPSYAFFEQLKHYEEKTDEIRTAIEPWITQSLQYNKEFVKSDEMFIYRPTPHTLVPTSYLEVLWKASARPGTYYRDTACESTNSKLYRIGEPFIDFLNQYIEWDDRGRSYAFNRYVSGIEELIGGSWAGFCFHYIIEGDLSRVQNFIRSDSQMKKRNIHSLKRAMDQYSPPAYRTVCVRSDGQVEEQSEILAWLDPPFHDVEKGGTDSNLIKNRLGIIGEVISDVYWPSTCHAGRQNSETWLREEPSFKEAVCGNSQHTELLLNHAFTQISLRARQEHMESRLSDITNADLQLEKKMMDAILHGVQNPTIRLDSVGFVMLTNKKTIKVR